METPARPAPRARRISFLSLPDETQREIFSYCRTPELVCLALVSKRFHFLSAEFLYREVAFEFDGTTETENQIAAVFDTFATSSYNYARHLRELALDSSDAGARAERLYERYLYSHGCGKLLNTLLLTTLRKAQSLEAFTWNVRIELSRPVYKALHNIETLSHLSIRLQKGPSLYQPPPPLPISTSTSHATNSSPAPSPSPSATVPPPPSTLLELLAPSDNPFPSPAYAFGYMATPTPIPSSSNTAVYNLPVHPHSASPLTSPRHKTAARPSPRAREPPTISGFKNLKTLAVLDIDSLDIVTELNTCLRNSSGSLTRLTLSLSDSLAAKSRKPTADHDADESDTSDVDFHMPPPATTADTTAGALDSSTSSKTLRIQEERLRQEAFLGKVFDVEPAVIPGQANDASGTTDNPSGEEDPTSPKETTSRQNIDVTFLKSLRDLVLFLEPPEGSGNTGSVPLSHHKRQTALDMIEKAARKYLESRNIGDSETNEKKEPEVDDPESAKGELAASGSGDPPTDAVSLYAKKQDGNANTKRSRDVSPDDFDIEEPEGQLVLEDDTCEKDAEDSSDRDVDVEPPLPSGDDLSEQDARQNGNGCALVSDSKDTPEVEDKGSEVMNVGDGARPTEKSQLSRRALVDSAAKLRLNLEAQNKNSYALLEKLTSLRVSMQSLKTLMDKVKQGNDTELLAEVKSQIKALEKDVSLYEEQIRVVGAEARDIEVGMSQMLQQASDLAGQSTSTTSTTSTAAADKVLTESQRTRQLISTYVRSTRGLALEEFSAFLIPVKASVLNKAVDLRVLRSITLLNVGQQAPIWSLLAKENKVEPLPLRHIITDNVSKVLLNMISQLKELHSLVFFEWDSRHKPESFAPKTAVDMGDIRRIVLKKHLPHLKVLVLNNAASQDWDIDERTVKLLSKAGSLKELAGSMNMRGVHALLRRLPDFKRLYALRIIRLRNDDTCVWVLNEVKRFLLDALTHCPHLLLEWVMIDNNSMKVDRLVRQEPKGQKKGHKKQKEAKKTGKAKGKETAVGSHIQIPGLAAASASITTPLSSSPNGIGTGNAANGSNENDYTDSDMDSNDTDGTNDRVYPRVKIVTETFQACDVWESDIFSTEYMNGRL